MPSVASPTASALLDRFADRLRTRFGERVAEVVLFGSHARGDTHEDSDVDVLVVVAGLTVAEGREILDLAYELSSASEDWGALSPLARSTEAVRDLRAGGRRLWRDIDVEGVRW